VESLGAGLFRKALVLLERAVWVAHLATVAATLGLEVLSQGAAQQQIQPQQLAQVPLAETTLAQRIIGEPLAVLVVAQT
jgi:hypothetical protein